MKKIISLFVAVLMVVLTFSITATSAIATVATGSISGAAKTANIGETVDVIISLDKNPGLVSLQIDVGYDANVFTLIGITDAGKLSTFDTDTRNLSRNPFTITWNGDLERENITYTGVIATLEFAVSNNIELIGSVSPIMLTARDALDYEMDDIVFAKTDVKVTISHDHTWENDWTSNDTHHWHECTLHDAIDVKAAHIAATSVQENIIEPTDCTTDGSYDEVTYCAVCGYEMSRETKVIKAPGHKWEATWSIDPGYHWRECTVCGDIQEKKHYSSGTVQENIISATCAAEGSYDKVTYCADCGFELSRETITIKKIPHTPAEAVIENLVPATCTADGFYDDVIYCADCGNELSRETITIKKIPHTPAEAVIENLVPATCTADGSYDEVVYCTECGIELSRELKTIKKLGHDFSEEWTDDSTFHWHKCIRCDAIKDKQNHNLIPATNGNYVCDVCNHELNITRDAYADFEKTELARPGRELKVIVKLNNTDKAIAFALSDITYDKSALSLKSVKWISEVSGLSSWDEKNDTFAIMFVDGMNTQVESKYINGDIVELTFDVLKDAQDGEYEIGLDCQYITDSYPICIPVIKETVTLRRFLPGDLNEDEAVTSDDALYLLFHLFFPEIYEANQPVDFNGDKTVDIKDAIHLLFYVYFPQYYKLNY